MGEYFDLHHDSSTKFQKRKITFLIYLNDVDEDVGGETYFPLAGIDNTDDEGANGQKSSSNQMLHQVLSESSINTKGKGLYVKPQMGRVVLFMNLNENGEPNPKVNNYPLHNLA